MYELLLAIHLLAAVTWVGGSIALTVLATRFSPEDRRTVAPQFNWYGSRVITGSAVVLLIAGFGLVGELQSVEITDPWILIALAAYLVSFVLGAAVIGPAGDRIGKLAEAGDLAGADSAFERVLLFSRIDTVLVVLVVIDMAVKPGA